MTPFDRGTKAELAGTSTRKVKVAAPPLAAVLPATAAEQQWPRFRGPSGQGLTGRRDLPIHWDKSGT